MLAVVGQHGLPVVYLLVDLRVDGRFVDPETPVSVFTGKVTYKWVVLG